MDAFPLQKLLDTKVKLLDTKEAEMKRLQRKIEDFMEMILIIQLRTKEYWENNVQSPMIGSDFAVFLDYLVFLDSEKMRLQEEQIHIEQAADALKLELIELLKEIRTLEKLRATRMQTARQAQNRRDQKRIDAMSLRTHSRKS
jgi:flagellar export protein FliJ